MAQQWAAVNGPAEDTGQMTTPGGEGADPAARFLIYLESALPDVYDFAYRLFRSEREAEQAIETALRAMLKAPAQSLSSGEKFLVRLCAETYLVAESTPDLPAADGDEFTRLSPGVPPAITPEIGVLIWQAASSLPPAEYAALHLQSRLKLTRETVAEALGMTPAYTYILLGRAQRHFEEALSAALLLRWTPAGCQQLAAVTSEASESGATCSIDLRVSEHLATGCPVCRRYLSGYGEIAGLLAALAPVPSPGLFSRLTERLRERLETFDETAMATAAAMTAPVVALAGTTTGAEPGLQQTRFGRFRQWWDEHNLTRAALVTAGALVVLVIAVALIAFRPSRNDTSTVVDVLGLRPSTEGAGENDGSIIGRASTPTTGRLPEVAAPSSTEQAAPSQPAAVQTVEQEPTPWLTATPQNRAASGPVVILNPVPANPVIVNSAPVNRTTSQAASGQAAPAAEAQAVATPEPPAPTATPVPTPPPPRLALSTQSLTFGSGETVKTVVLQNAGTGQVRWNVVPQQAWLLASPSGGVVSDGPTSLQIQVDRSIGGTGRRQGSLAVNSSAGNMVISVTVE